MNFELSKHALEQMARRNIEPVFIKIAIGEPDFVIDQGDEIKVFSKLVNEDSKKYLYRVFVNWKKNPSLVITVYKTSKIEKYVDKI